MRQTYAVGVALAVAVVAVALGGLFVADFGSATPEPADFDETVTVGLALEDEFRLEDKEDINVALPRVQVFYSQYPYAVGYYGVGTFVETQRQPAHEQRFGYPTVTYVTDYAGHDIELTERGEPVIEDRLVTGWVPADSAVYVVGSEAETPGGEAVLPFSDRDDAAAYADEHGGEVVDWETILDRSFDIDDAATVRDRVDDQARAADATVTNRTALLDRPVETVVGEDEPTLQAAIDAAPPETTVHVPPGTYDGPVEVDAPITVRGEAASVHGDGNGTVVTVSASDAAVSGLNISGVGTGTPGPTVTGAHAHGVSEGGGHDHGADDEDSTWDAGIEDDYAVGDAGIAVNVSEDALIADTEIRTPAAGIILRNAPGTVVRNVSVVGNESFQQGHMGLVAMRSPGVFENSTFARGLDGVYTHRADGAVIRDNEMTGNRMGVHTMFSSGVLLADNTITDQQSAGIYVMTGPQRNGIVGNEISDTPMGINIGGTDTYVADNVLVENDLGFRLEATASIIERNVVADNRDGAEAWSLLPTNRVTHNDFVGNERHITVSSGPLRVWTHDGRGNYWEGAVGPTDGTVIERPYTPTGEVDSLLHQSDGAPALAQAPATDALAGFEGSMPGMRANEIVDTAPLCSPANEAWFEQNDRTNLQPVCRADSETGTHPNP
ncbi:ABC-type transport system periplasmic substrate-binding protein (probable substrate copper) [Natronomonas pharaonis DSM 2160]|uniref:ABC-type transport system periplasmic substrate-binding protein (Probable substrate copper) n=1 Tax=Natronomonas pharaonis (strain ATCC 35678 / DSM 2160 / CIP 103997 / JCM 8858 / NBRC 14720 / NCIMB 2260 / Gabara) TaxID=348780 RepID=A0A1U7EXV4_NATPD|nr:ABC-type transport system periplasmic substrate-binding protein (probable substrate copper) [Natronomonas pharaonis DSM 2160]